MGVHGVMVMLTALPAAYRALRAHLEEPWECVHPRGTVFEVGRTVGWQVALAELGEGNQSAAVITERARSWLDPRALFFVGAAGALKQDIRLGDVVVATKVYGCHGGGRTGAGLRAQPGSWEASHRLEQTARAALRDRRWTRRLGGAAGPSAPGPGVHFEPIVAGEVVPRARGSTLAGRPTRHRDDAVAIERESAGVAQAAHLTGELHTLTICGISDKAGAMRHRAEAAASQPRAAAHAAAAAFAVLDQLGSLGGGPSAADGLPAPAARRGAAGVDGREPAVSPGTTGPALRSPPAPVRAARPVPGPAPAATAEPAAGEADPGAGLPPGDPGAGCQQAGPTLARMLVGQRLRRLREARNISGDEAGRAIRASQSKISRVERGRIGCRPRDAADLLTLYGVTDAGERAALLALAEQTNAPGWLHPYRDLLPGGLGGRVELEQCATMIRCYDSARVPDLLQVEAYTGAVIRSEHPSASASDVRRRLELHSRRRQLLHRPRPPTIWMIIDEAALHRRIGDAATMRAQLAHLIEINNLAHVAIQFMPFRAGPAAAGGIALLRPAVPELEDVMYLDQGSDTLRLRTRADIAHYRAVIDRLCVRAESVSSTRAALVDLLRKT